MITATRNWFNRNRTRLAVGAGVLGAGYLAAQYALNKLNEARQRMSDDRIARENLRRRFTQNQQDCTYTVLALLPTATDHILHELPVENITAELQARKTEKLSRSAATSELAPSEIASTSGDANTDSVSASGFIHASQTVDSAEGEHADRPATPARSKLQLWDDLKIASVVRAFTLIYTLALLTMLTRIQLNLLGRRNYLSSVVSLASPSPEGSQKISLENRDDDNMEQDYGSDFDTNRKYLTFSWWLLHKGWKDVKDRVDTAVKEVFGTLTPRDSLTFEKLSELTLSVRKHVEGATDDDRRERAWLEYLMPPKDAEEFVLKESGVLQSSPGATSPPLESSPTITSSLRRLIDETSDLIDSPTFTHVLTLTLDAAFSLLVDDKIAVQAYKIGQQGHPEPLSVPDAASILETNPLIASEGRITELTDEGHDSIKQTQCKLATVLAVLTRQAHAIGSGALIDTAGIAMPGMAESSFSESNEYLKAMEDVRDLEAFAAVVYSSNFEFEGIELDNDAMPGNSDTDLAESAIDASASFVDVGADADAARLENAWGKASYRSG
ncbi:hypothetical protein FH972_023498 [Carpinus fangiana]|uniref:Peroxin-3 n=1 Tax=Carpinus fangiana TaxID=176857 RepID=A0A5N6KVC1_9ROSI|nr:hypothetical protein FH972_023498 [Carpinus fangiana]